MSCKLIGIILTEDSACGSISSLDLSGDLIDDSKFSGHLVDESDYSGRISSVFLDLKGEIEDSVIEGHLSC